MAKPPAQVYQIKVTLNDTRPPIWRRIQVPADTTLRKLHDILQIVMGWTDSHLHQFVIGGANYGATEYDEGGELELLPEQRYRLGELVPKPGTRFQYEYDFGDGWEHSLLVEKIQPPEPGMRYPLCQAGKRACPPEDVGGVWGYQDFLKAIRNPRHPEHDEYTAWIGGDFDPEAFDPDDINARLRRMGRGRSVEVVSAWGLAESGTGEGHVPWESAWAQALSAAEQATAESLPLRRDMLALLTYLRDQRVTGTPGTGNLPLKAVHAICAQFVHPLELETTIGDHVYRVRSETEVWPLYFRHVLASIAGLVTGGSGRRWCLTPLGERYLEAQAAQQVWALFVTWWMKVNWAIASPWSFGDGQMPAGFISLTLQRLLALPVGERVSFEPFADHLIADGPLIWPIENQDSARTILHGIVTRVVIGPLHDFGVLATEYGPNPILGPGYEKLLAFELARFGQGLLTAIQKGTRSLRP